MDQLKVQMHLSGPVSGVSHLWTGLVFQLDVFEENLLFLLPISLLDTLSFLHRRDAASLTHSQWLVDIMSCVKFEQNRTLISSGSWGWLVSHRACSGPLMVTIGGFFFINELLFYFALGVFSPL